MLRELATTARHHSLRLLYFSAGICRNCVFATFRMPLALISVFSFSYHIFIILSNMFLVYRFSILFGRIKTGFIVRQRFFAVRKTDIKSLVIIIPYRSFINQHYRNPSLRVKSRSVEIERQKETQVQAILYTS